MASGWVKLRVRTGTLTTDDTDHVDLQTSPAASELIRFGGRKHSRQQTAMQVMVTWIDDNDEILDPGAGTTRGSFDLELLKVLSLTDEDPDDATVICDGTTLTSCEGYKIYQFDGMTGDQIWVRLTNVVVPTSGSPTKMQIWVCPLERG